MKGQLRKSNALIANITKKFKKIRNNGFSGLKDNISAKRTLSKVGNRLEQWIVEGKHHEIYNSMDEILDELGLTSEELSLYCSRILKKKFLSWRKELRIKDAKVLLLEHPESPVCHIGYIVGFNDKSNFRQQFREVVGCTPTEWRALNIKKNE